jgi:hypothetical protein
MKHLLCFFVFNTSLVLAQAEEVPSNPSPNPEPVAAASPTPAPASPPISSDPFALKITGISQEAVQLVPSITVALQLTTDQAEALKAARDASYGLAARDSEGMDQKRKNRLLDRAKQEFSSSRDSILTEAQISFIGTVRTALADMKTQLKAEGNSQKPRRTVFLEILAPRLTPEQKQLMEGAGVQFP